VYNQGERIMEDPLDAGILALKTAWEREILKEFGNKMWMPELDDEYKPWFFNPHGICHAYSVKRNSVKLYKKYISPLHTDPISYKMEKLILEISALSHDLSMISPDIKKWNSPNGFKELRKKHGEYSYQIVKNLEKAILRFDYEEGSNQVFSLDLGDFMSIVGFLVKHHNGKKHIKKNKLQQRVLSVYVKDTEYRVKIRPYLLLPILRIADLIDDNYERFNPEYTPSRRIKETTCPSESEGYLKILNKAVAWGYIFGGTFAEQIKFYLRTMVVRENPLDNLIGTGYNNKTFIVSLSLYKFPSNVTFYPERDWKITITQETVEQWLRDYLDLEIDEVASSRINGYSNRILKEFGLPLIKYQLEYTEANFPIEEVFKMTYIRDAIQFLLRKLKSNDISSLITTTYRLKHLLHGITIPEIIVPYKIENEPTHYALLINKNTTNQGEHNYELFSSPTPSVSQRPIEPLVKHLSELYEDFELIGQGGFAWVYRARRRKDGRVVALKIPKNLDTATGKAFLREISNWLHLKHPNIVELYDANVLPIPYLEMEYCDKPLSKLRKPVSIDEAVLIILNIAEGLKYAHSRSIIHRDLKPSNVLLKAGIPKISDWSLSKVMSESRSSTTTTSFTLLYAAPEQLSKSQFGHTDKRTDIWSLGVIFYELVTGRLPFDGSDLGEIMFSIIGKEPIPPSTINPEAKLVEPIIMKMLAKDKAKRYGTVEQLQNDLLKVFMEILPTKTEFTTATKNIRLVEYFKYMFIAYLRAGNLENAYRMGTELELYITDSAKLEKFHRMLSQLSVFLKEGIKPSPETINSIEEAIIWLV